MTNDTRRPTPHISLSIKLLAAFALVVVVASSAVAILSHQSATREFTRFVQENQADRAEPPAGLIDQLADYYDQQGSWAGVGELLGQTGLGTTGEQSTIPLLVVDAQGQLVASNWSELLQDQLAQQMTDGGWPIEVDGQTVGTLVSPGRRPLPPAPAPGWLGPEGIATVERIRRAILIAGLSAGAVALVVAGGLTWGLVRPLRRLTTAAEGIARGDLSQRVPVTSNDEVGELAATFNRMAAELGRAERLRRNMTIDIAHELRTPLSVIRGKLEGVLDGVYPATPEHLQPILEATGWLTVLVEDLRLLAQAEAGQLALKKRPVSIGDLLQDAVVNFEPQASDRGVTLSLELPAEVPQVTADWHRLNQVVSNLLLNALQHTPAEGQVRLTAATADGQARVTVSDTGTGIPAEDLPHVFDRFWRGEKSRSRASGGIGLGLAIARQLVELHGGTIGAESAPGRGSTFWFSLPIV